MDGILNIYKEKGYTSFDVVAKLRGVLHQKKIGHTGTLDPDATGVLPICLGKATKVCELLTNKNKKYHATIQLGKTTDTQDATGTILSEKDSHVTEEQLKEVLQHFYGEIEQVPPMYSAIKINGKRLYELARQGIEVERKARRITIFSLMLSEFDYEKQTFSLDVTCSKGTYIRTLCHDIGQKLGCGAVMTSLERTAVSAFYIKDSLTIQEVENLVANQLIEEKIQSIDSVFDEYPKVLVKDVGLKYLINGNKINSNFCEFNDLQYDEFVRMYDTQNRFYALYQYKDDGCFIIRKMFYNHLE